MSLKVNNGHSFLHPVSGVMIGPGQFYQSYDEPNEEIIVHTLNPEDPPAPSKKTSSDKTPDGEVNPDGSSNPGQES
jgi:hypothetical protein